MFKNILILALTISVLSMGWLLFADLGDKERVIADLKEAGKMLKESFDSENKEEPSRHPDADAERSRNHGTAGMQKKPAMKSPQEIANKPELTNQYPNPAEKLDQLNHKEKLGGTNSVASKNINIDNADNGVVTNEDVQSILSILHSAQKILQKSTFAVDPMREKDEQNEDDKEKQVIELKKKLSKLPNT